ncbi:hypothetical protein ACFORL_10765 [Legionella dresdenensis]|uniref:Uncharacterized protein n=1 Tax=Legionella dresdenensis TaxID=450200 RepID=A0ABV8CHE9_9GAMM
MAYPGCSEPDRKVLAKIKPAQLLAKAYTVIEFDKNGRPRNNREQVYIDFGEKFATYCHDNPTKLTRTQTLLNEVGIIISASNSVISQMNVITDKIHSKKDKEEITMAIYALKLHINNLTNILTHSPILKIEPAWKIAVREQWKKFKEWIFEVIDNMLGCFDCTAPKP